MVYFSATGTHMAERDRGPNSYLTPTA